MLNILLVTKMLKKLTFMHIFPKMSLYRINFDKTRCMYFLVKDVIFLEKYNEIWEKVGNSMKKN